MYKLFSQYSFNVVSVLARMCFVSDRNPCECGKDLQLFSEDRMAGSTETHKVFLITVKSIASNSRRIMSSKKQGFRKDNFHRNQFYVEPLGNNGIPTR